MIIHQKKWGGGKQKVPRRGLCCWQFAYISDTHGFHLMSLLGKEKEMCALLLVTVIASCWLCGKANNPLFFFYIDTNDVYKLDSVGVVSFRTYTALYSSFSFAFFLLNILQDLFREVYIFSPFLTDSFRSISSSPPIFLLPLVALPLYIPCGALFECSFFSYSSLSIMKAKLFGQEVRSTHLRGDKHKIRFHFPQQHAYAHRQVLHE